MPVGPAGWSGWPPQCFEILLHVYILKNTKWPTQVEFSGSAIVYEYQEFTWSRKSGLKTFIELVRKDIMNYGVTENVAANKVEWKR